jgi:hypothetical protein
VVHVPPVGVEERVVVEPEHTVVAPVIAPGFALTVTTNVAGQPRSDVNVITDVPAATPVTSPVEVTVAFAGVPEVHEPADASLRLVVAPTHTAAVPVIAGGSALTVTIVEVEQPVVSV